MWCHRGMVFFKTNKISFIFLKENESVQWPLMLFFNSDHEATNNGREFQAEGGVSTKPCSEWVTPTPQYYNVLKYYVM